MEENIKNEFREIDLNHYLPTFRRYPLVFEKGKGAKVWDVDGKEYIDLLAGIAVNNVGHCHDHVVEAIREQAGKLIHISNFYLSKPQALLTRKLVGISGLNRVFFSNSGAESVEGAIKVARKYAHSLGRGGTVISMQGSFHGRTLATIATGKASMQKGFDPIPTGFVQLPFNDLDSIKKAANKQIAAVIVEPIQGEGGINVADEEFLRGLREICDAHNIVLIFDEIQCGIGRTGKWFAKDHYGVQPDIMTLAKGLGGGTAIGAILFNEKVSQAIDYGDHGTTFGGNPLACAAGLATLEVIEKENLMQAAEEKGQWIRDEITSWQDPDIQQIKGKGMMLGVEFSYETKPLVQEMMHHGVLANATAGNILRLVPPLVISKEELNQALSILKSSMKAIKQHA